METRHQALLGDGYARMFPDLRPCEKSEQELIRLSQEMTRANHEFTDSSIPCGYTYFGQFIAHDISRMRTEDNVNVPSLNLTSVYGNAKQDWSKLFLLDGDGDLLFKIEQSESLTGNFISPEYDLPRAEAGKPIIPDERNDNHIIISQLHLAFLCLHNRLTTLMRKVKPDLKGVMLFDRVRREVCWTYQWLVIHDFLKRLCHSAIFDHFWPASGERHQLGEILPFDKVPFEFALAGFRFGHALVRGNYKINKRLPARPLFHKSGSTFGSTWGLDLRGHRRLPPEWSVQWDLLLRLDQPLKQPARSISPYIEPYLSNLPTFVIAEGLDHDLSLNLAERTLRAGKDAGLPAGQDVARWLSGYFGKIGLPIFAEIDENDRHPLWYYVLKEAMKEGGSRLGPVGSWIVASTITHILHRDPNSFAQLHGWKPTLPNQAPEFSLRDLIEFSGLPCTEEQWRVYIRGERKPLS